MGFRQPMLAAGAAAAMIVGCALDRAGLGSSDAGQDAGAPDAAGDACARESCRVSSDDTFGEFAAGSLGESVANLYVQAGGTVQTVMRSDVDHDGYPDLVVGSSRDGTNYLFQSRIYLGAPGGPSPAVFREVPTMGAHGSATADLNADGWADLVFANFYDGTSFATVSYVYWGSREGFETRAELPTTGASGVTVADLDADGWLDLIFASVRDDDRHDVPSLVYLGGPDGFAPERRIALPTTGAIDVCVADFDRDGHLDLLFTNYYDDVTSYVVPVHVYFGTAEGPDPAPERRQELPATGAYGCAIADLNHDDQLDAVIAQYYDGTSGSMGSRVYFGRDGRLEADRLEILATTYGALPSIADVDGNDYLDVIVGNVRTAGGSSARTSSSVFFRTARDFDTIGTYPTLGAFGTAALDWTGDGRIDLLFTSHADDAGSFRLAARLYTSRPDMPPANTAWVGFPSTGGWGAMSNDLGHTYDRRFRERFVSRALDLGEEPRGVTLSWEANVPTGTALRFEVRSADRRADLERAEWGGPGGPDTLHETSPAPLVALRRFVQYRAVFDVPNAGSSPVLDRVTWRWR
jgi:hypothetical protein